MQGSHSICLETENSETNEHNTSIVYMTIGLIALILITGCAAQSTDLAETRVDEIPRSLLLSREEVLAVLDELEQVKSAIRKDSKNAQLHFQAGLLEQRLERWSDALNHFKEAYNRNSKFAEAYYHAGFVAEKVDESYELNPEEGERRGRTVGGPMHRFAIDSYKSALKYKPNYPDAQYRLCSAYLYDSDLPRAVDAYQKFKALESGTARERELLARVYELQKAQPKD